MNKDKLRIAMLESGKKVEDLCIASGMSTVSFYRKLRGVSEFTQGEISAISKELKLSGEAICNIFFDRNVS